MQRSRKQQPKRKVVEVGRVGAYPKVWWEHRLECGHIERRKRKSPATQVACGKCDSASTGLVVVDDESTLAQYEALVQSRLARLVRVEPEAVEVSAYMDGGYAKLATATISFYRDFA